MSASRAANCDRLRFAKEPSPKALKRQRRTALNENTAEVRAAVFERDAGNCRIPWCSVHLIPFLTNTNELAHLKGKGIGGDHGLRTTTENCIVACREHHRGDRSLHSTHIQWRFLTDAGANGPMAFEFCEQLPTEIK